MSLFAPEVQLTMLVKLGKTFHERTCKNLWTYKDSVINNHLDECGTTKHLFTLSNLTSSLFSDSDSNNGIDVRF